MVRERTVITTVEVTMVYKDVNEGALSKEAIADLQKQIIKMN